MTDQYYIIKNKENNTYIVVNRAMPINVICETTGEILYRSGGKHFGMTKDQAIEWCKIENENYNKRHFYAKSN